MSRKTMLIVFALVSVVLVGLAGSYWAYKKIQQKRNQEYRFEAKMNFWEGFEVNKFRAFVLTDDTLVKVIESNDLVDFWEVADTETAMFRMREKFKVRVVEMQIRVSFQDRDKEMAQKVLHDLMGAYQEKVKAVQGLPTAE
jgi:hypothetical protein